MRGKGWERRESGNRAGSTAAAVKGPIYRVPEVESIAPGCLRPTGFLGEDCLGRGTISYGEPACARAEGDLTLTEPLDTCVAENFVSLFQNCPEGLLTEAGGGSHRAQVGGGGVGGVEAGEPVAAVAQEVVAHFAVGFHVVGEGEVAQPEHEGDVHLLWSVLPFREVQGEGVAEFGWDGGGERFIKAGEGRREEFSGAGQVFK